MFRNLLIVLVILPCLIIKPIICYSQIGEKLTIIDLESNKPIPFASVFIKQKQVGLYANESGIFELPKNISLGDTLLISSIGYEQNLFVYKTAGQQFHLKSKANILNEVNITPKGNEIILGSLKKESHFVVNLNQLKARNELALLITNPNKYKGKLLSVSFYINPQNKPQTPFRVRIYDIDDNEPGTDLLTKDLIVNGNRKGGWIEVFIDNTNIPFGVNGVFVSMESLYGIKKSSFYKVTNLGSGKITEQYGQSLGLTDEFSSASAYQRQFNDTWKPFAQKFPKNISEKTFYPMIRVKVKLDE